MGTLPKHVRAADHVFDIARSLAARGGAAWRSLTERRVRPDRNRAYVIPLASAIGLAYSPAAFAGPAACQPTSGDVVCSGNQSAGVKGSNGSKSNDFQTNNTNSLTVDNLTSDIIPAIGSGPVYGIEWSLLSSSPQPGVQEFFSSPDHSVSATSFGAIADGVDLDSRGGPNGYGRFLQMFVNGSVSASGTGGAAVNGFVNGGSGTTAIDDGASGTPGFSGGGLGITVGPTPTDHSVINGEISGSGEATNGIAAIGKGGGGGDGAFGVFHSGGNGGDGGAGATVSLTVSGGAWKITTHGQTAPGALLQSNGGAGANGGSSSFTTGGHGGAGGQGGDVSFDNRSAPVTVIAGAGDAGSPGLLLISQAGSGGSGGSGKFSGDGGKGGAGGGGGPIDVFGGLLNITTAPNSPDSPGVAAYSLGGTGGNGGDGGFFNGGSGDGGGTGPSGVVTVNVQRGMIQTAAATSAGIIAQSIAGHAGTGGGNSVTAASFGAAGGSAGAAGTVDVTNGATIRTNNDQSVALFAQSAGGGGGNGGGGFGIFYSGGGPGGNGGDGGMVTVTNTGALTTSGADSEGIFAQSVGGAGGDGGIANSVFAAIGGRANYGSNGGTVTVVNSGTISTGADRMAGVPIEHAAIPICGVGCSQGILAQSIGGGGGNGGATIAEAFSMGGTAGGGGNGGEVDVTNTGDITTRLVNSPGIAAQSIGGGGGNGGGSVAGGLFATVAIGGSGGDGGSGGPVQVHPTSGMAIQTEGTNSAGIFAQSIGGGGGNGGYADSVALGPTNFALSASVGGTGGKGGNGQDAVVNTLDSKYSGPADIITTAGPSSDGILDQSVGGGGGNGGFAISVAAAAEGLSVAFAMGGKGGVAGNGGAASLTSDANVTTHGDQSSGLVAQSIGGAGGNGGFAVSGAFQLSGVGASVAFGGAGDSGGSASDVTLTNSGTVTTSGAKADGVFAQSIGGGGGDGGVTVAAAGSAAGGKGGGDVTLGVGANGGRGGNAGQLVTLNNYGSVTATGAQSKGVVAESTGGGGGDGSLTISAAIQGSQPHELALSIGGNGALAGNGGAVILKNTASVQTGSASLDPVMAENSPGVVASSAGGGGGEGSWIGSFAGAGGSAEGTPLQGAVAVGGAGGAAGNAGNVTLDNSGKVTTYANESPALLGSSIGGGGGDAGYVLAGTALIVKSGAKGGAFTLAVGRAGGGGGRGGIVDLTNGSATLQTFGMDSDAIHARSEGGGGGDAGAVLAFTATTAEDSFAADVAVGGSGGSGSFAGGVTADNFGTLITAGKNSYGIRAESVGGSGGDGAFTLSADSSSKFNEGYAANVAVGGDGGTGNTGGAVTVNSHGSITTTGDQADGISAQSIGGGGGNSRWTMAVPLRTRVELSIEVGREGGPGDNSGIVEVDNYNNVTTTGAGSLGIVAQSIGGGGGFSQATSVGISFQEAAQPNNPFFEADSVSLGATVGMPGASGGDGGQVTVNNSGVITTGGGYADGISPAGIVATKEYGIFAQSIGGGGGAGGSATSLLPDVANSDSTLSATVDVGGKGGEGGISKLVTVTNKSAGTITTSDTESYGIFAQSIGGGGGAGGIAAASPGILKDGSNKLNVNIAVGGKGGTGNSSGVVTVENDGSVTTHGAGSHGVLAQSIGGGGGDGGSAFDYIIGLKSTPGASLNLGLSLGGAGGDTGVGNDVNVTNSGAVTTTGSGANGIEAQSIGGGGGEGGNGSSVNTLWKGADINVGGKGGAGNNGGTVTITQTPGAAITTTGGGSSGIYAQSIGGGGGRGGVGVYLPATPLTVALGGTGGANGDGGAVTVDVKGGSITIGAGSSFGIFAQSIGGGGGQAGGIGIGIIDTPYYTPPPNTVGIIGTRGAESQSSGKGGPVNVTMNGSLSTMGADAIGIYAQSVGGGGGLSGQSGDASCPAGNCSELVGSNGNPGSAGPVNVTVNGTITTNGQYSHAIFAQSAAGTTSPAGNVTVSLAPGSSVLANGADANAIFAQSVGGADGAIDVSVGAGAVVQGGSGDSSSGIHFLDGTAGNTLENAGTITTLNGENGLDVRSDGGNLTIENSGSLIGAMDLNGPRNAGPNSAPERITNSGQIIGDVQIHNQASVVVNGGRGKTFGSWTGGAITVGAGNLTFAGGNTVLGDNVAVNGGAGTVTNDGRLLVTAPIAVTGSFDQSGTGKLDFLLSSSTDPDQLSVTGAVSLAGGLGIDLLSGFNLVSGDSFDLIGSDGALSGGFSAFSLDGAACSAHGGDDWRCGGFVFDLSMVTGALDSVDLSVAGVGAGAAPEPSTWVMLAVGFLGLGGLALRRRERSLSA
jgi:hypothetical protein